jgi:hypothetical protein
VTMKHQRFNSTTQLIRWHLGADGLTYERHVKLQAQPSGRLREEYTQLTNDLVLEHVRKVLKKLVRPDRLSC